MSELEIALARAYLEASGRDPVGALVRSVRDLARTRALVSRGYARGACPGPLPFSERVLPRPAIEPARSDDDLRAAAALMRAYAAALDVDLADQDFEAELASLPGAYAPPAGALLLARDGTGRAVGCVALRPLEAAGGCEMKRLYVAPEGRRLGTGEALARAALGAAAGLGYREVRLDALPSMAGAQALYRKLGFEPAEPHYDTPVAGTLFLRRRLA